MCGLVGFLGGEVGAGGDEALRQGSGHALLRRMADTLIHRGPDDGGVWCDSEQRIGLGHSDVETLLAGFEAWGVEARA